MFRKNLIRITKDLRFCKKNDDGSIDESLEHVVMNFYIKAFCRNKKYIFVKLELFDELTKNYKLHLVKIRITFLQNNEYQGEII